jgi:hypothetical protein
MSFPVPFRKLLWVSLFAAAFGYVEASVVVYLRAIYYPDMFEFPLKMMRADHVTVELFREAATIVMLAAVGSIAGRKGWQRFGFFLTAFGLWDIFYYIWLKATLNWPAALTDWDVLFLIPLPWIGPVISAASVAALMTICGVGIVVRTALDQPFRPTLLSWLLAVAATAVILYSFMYDTDATLRGHLPVPYRYELLVIGLGLYLTSYALACRAKTGVVR